MNNEVDNTRHNLTYRDLEVGQKFLSATQTIDAEAIKTFARQYDPQPFHTDDELARDTLFGGLVASGWHTACISMRLMVESAHISGGMVGVAGEISWPRPTRPGDTLQVETEVLEIKPSKSHPDRGVITVRSITRNQNGEDVQILTSKIVVPK